MLLISGGEICAPQYLGKKDILVCGNKIERIADHIDITASNVEITRVNASGKFIVPGFIDQHEHVLGAGGEGGFTSRTPEMQVSNIVKYGITTVVGLHGTDGTARNIESLYAKVCALEEEGITCRMLTCSYEVLSPTLCGSVHRDVIFIDKVIGVKTAISDRRSSHPSKDEILRIISQAYTGGLISGKRGYTHFHMGNEPSRLSMLKEIIRETQIPPYLLVPTHVNRDKALFEDAIEFAKMGGTVDITSGIGPEYGIPGAVKPSTAIRMMLEAGVSVERITMSTDANGSMALYDANGNCTSIFVTTVDSLTDELRDMVNLEKLPLSTALKFITSNVALCIGMSSTKGSVKEGYDADLVFLTPDLQVDAVFAKGRLVADSTGPLIHSVFAK